MAKPSEAGMEALHRLKFTDPPSWLAPSDSLSTTARTAAQHLFSWLKPYDTKSPFDQLLVDGFDAEQIWQQIDLQSQPLISSLRRQVKNFEKNPDEISKGFEKVLQGDDKKEEEKEDGRLGEKRVKWSDELDDDDDDDDDDDVNEDEDDMDDDGDDDEDSMDDDGGDDDEKDEGGGFEDKFFKVKELEKYLEEDEAREYGLDEEKNKEDRKKSLKLGDEDEDGDEDGDEDELGLFDGDSDDDDDVENARYEDFFVAKNKSVQKRKIQKPSVYDEEDDASDEEETLSNLGKQPQNLQSEVDEMHRANLDTLGEGKGDLSTHEKQLQKLRSEIEQMERANLEPKTWTMQGEVTAASRPKNSALEVDLDFEHNMRPAPVITEEITATIEDLIKNRITEGRFDDVQKVLSLPSKAPKELKELDDNKSQKGLAEVYEEEYVQKTNPATSPLSLTGEKKEASMLFKKLCLKLDALSHFHFAPKPVIEDMSIQSNVPALAMEEIAPIAVSDAAMLAPEEVFSGKGDIKEEAELTQAERKRRRAKKKRKFKAEATKRMAKKARDNTMQNINEGQEGK